jgi:hypothetical protein
MGRGRETRKMLREDRGTERGVGAIYSILGIFTVVFWGCDP